jgi:predicted metal-dependent HD superfamily phosphohydrolase
VLAGAEGSPDVIARVRDLVKATRHDSTPRSRDAALVVDVDLSILGAAPARFDAYERQVREEYAWVPDAVFRPKRRALLEGFLARSSIYSTAFFRERLEAAARANNARSLLRT